jgi:methyl-accepting chemotaxis protein
MVNNWKLWQKLALIAVLFSVPSALLMSIVLTEMSAKIAVSMQELDGLVYLEPLGHMRQAYWAYNATMDDPNATAAMVSERRVNVDHAFDELELAEKAVSIGLRTSDDYTRMREDWRALETTPEGTRRDSHLRTAIASEMAVLTGLVGDTSNLMLDSDITGFYLADGLIQKLPEVGSDLALLQKTLAHTGQDEPNTRSSLIVHKSLIAAAVAAMDYDLYVAFGHNKEVRARLEAPRAQMATQARDLLRELDVLLAATGPEPAIVASLQAKLADVAAARSALANGVAEQLHGQIAAREQQLREQKASLITLVTVVSLLALALVAWLARGVTNPLGVAVKMANRLADGELGPAAKIRSKDETGQLLAAMNTMTAHLRQLKNDIHSVASGVSTSATKMADRAESLALAAEEQVAVIDQVSRATKELADNNDGVADATLVLAGHMDVIAHAIENLVETVTTVARVTDACTSAARDAGELIRQTAALGVSLAIDAEAGRHSAEEAVSALNVLGEGLERHAVVRVTCDKATLSVLAEASVARQTLLDAVGAMDAIERIRRAEGQSFDTLASRTISLIEDGAKGAEILDRQRLIALAGALDAEKMGEAGRGCAFAFAELRANIEQIAGTQAVVVNGLGEMRQVATAAAATRAVNTELEVATRAVVGAMDGLANVVNEAEKTRLAWIELDRAGDSAARGASSIRPAVMLTDARARDLAAAANKVKASANDLVVSNEAMGLLVEQAQVAMHAQSHSVEAISTEVTSALLMMRNVSDTVTGQAAAAEQIAASALQIDNEAKKTAIGGLQIADTAQHLDLEAKRLLSTVERFRESTELTLRVDGAPEAAAMTPVEVAQPV